MKRCNRHNPPPKKVKRLQFKAEKYLHGTGMLKRLEARLDRFFKAQ
jgi:hypothetical protein